MEKKNSTVEGEKISYNDKFVIKLENRDINGRKKRLKNNQKLKIKQKQISKN